MAQVGKPLRILVLGECGGVSGVSSITIVDQIMQNIRHSLGLTATPRPSDWFDFIGGIGSGGLIAILFGRLGLTIDECYEFYYYLVRHGFRSEKTVPSLLRFLRRRQDILSSTALEDALVAIVQQQCKEETCRDILKQKKDCPHTGFTFANVRGCKTAILAWQKDDSCGEPTIFKTYSTDVGLRDSKIWEVGRATSASTGLYEPVRSIAVDNICDNPCPTLVSEACKIFPDYTVGCVVSIGRGSRKTQPPNASQPCALSSDGLPDRLSGQKYRHYRFDESITLDNVGFSNITKWAACKAHTMAYVNDNHSKIHACSSEISGILDTPSGSQCTPTLPFRLPCHQNRGFIGREDVLSKVENAFQGHRLVALTGLCGAGKTMIAIEYCYRFKKANRGMVFWIDASTAETLDKDFAAVSALRFPRKTADRDIVPESVARQINQGVEACPCLIVLDGFEDSRVASNSKLFSPLFWSNTYPNIKELCLITSRSRNLASEFAATGAIFDVTMLNEQDAIGLLHKYLPLEQEPTPGSHTLIQKLAYFPIAIDSLAQFIDCMNVTADDCLKIIEEPGKLANLLKIGTRGPDGHSSHSIHSKFTSTLSQIPDKSLRLLSILSVLDSEPVPHFLLPKRDIELFEEISPLINLFLIHSSPGFLSVHPLVRIYVLGMLKEQGSLKAWRVTALKMILATMPEFTYKNVAQYACLASHSCTVLQHDTGEEASRVKLLSKISSFFSLTGQFRRAENTALEAFRVVLASQDDNLKNDVFAEAFDQLVLSLSLRGKYLEIEQLYSGTEKSLGQTHGELRRLENRIAIELAHGNTDSAANIAVNVLTRRTTELGGRHVDTIRSIDLLALVQWHRGQYIEAERLSRLALEASREVLGDNHPGTLRYKLRLASVLTENDCSMDAAQLIFEARESSREVLGPRHPQTLQTSIFSCEAMEFLYQFRKAEALIREVLHYCYDTLGYSHPLSFRGTLLLVRIFDKQCKHAEARSLGAEFSMKCTALGIEERQINRFKYGCEFSFNSRPSVCSWACPSYDQAPWGSVILNESASSVGKSLSHFQSLFHQRSFLTDQELYDKQLVDPIWSMSDFHVSEECDSHFTEELTRLDFTAPITQGPSPTEIVSSCHLHLETTFQIPVSDYIFHEIPQSLDALPASIQLSNAYQTQRLGAFGDFNNHSTLAKQETSATPTTLSPLFNASDLAHVTDSTPNWTPSVNTALAGGAFVSAFCGGALYNGYSFRIKEKRECEEAERNRRAEDAALCEAGKPARWGYGSVHDPLRCHHSTLRHSKNDGMEQGPERRGATRKPFRETTSLDLCLEADTRVDQRRDTEGVSPATQATSAEASAYSRGQGVNSANHTLPYDEAVDDRICNEVQSNGPRERVHTLAARSVGAKKTLSHDEAPNDGDSSTTPKDGENNDLQRGDDVNDDGNLVSGNQKVKDGPHSPTENDNEDSAQPISHKEENVRRSSEIEVSQSKSSAPSESNTVGEQSSIYTGEEHTHGHPSSYQMKPITTPFSIMLPKCPGNIENRNEWHLVCTAALESAVRGEDPTEEAWKALKLGEPCPQEAHLLRPIPPDPEDRKDWHRRYYAIVSRVVAGADWSELEEKEFGSRGDDDEDSGGGQGPDNTSHERWIPLDEEMIPDM